VNVGRRQPDGALAHPARPQVGEVFGELNIETGKKTSTGQVSTSHDVLVELAQTYEIAQLIIDYREMDKLRATYAEALPKLIREDGRIHGCLNQTVAATGRLSSTDPNLQNIPVRTALGQEIRRSFIPEKGKKLISADYSQLELRILAHITQDAVMTKAFQDGEDIHANTARLVFGATDEKGGAVVSGVRFFASPTCHHAPEVYPGIGETRASDLLRGFFRQRRAD